MDNSKTLYKRDARGNIVSWSITKLDYGEIKIEHGILGKKLHSEIIKPTMVKANEVNSRINAKRKEGYKAIEDLYDNSPSKVTSQSNPRRGDESIDAKYLESYLNTYLPKYNTTSDGFVLPMLARTLEDNKPFEKFGTMLGQWKINGLRCIIGAEAISNDLFRKFRFTYTSREGTRWDLSWMDDIIFDNISSTLVDMMIEEGVCLDGELYLPGYSVNDINSFVKNPSLPQHRQLQYWCYDLAVDITSANKRNAILEYNAKPIKKGIISKDKHINTKEQFLILPSFEISNITEAIEHRDKFISLGFEGLILRNSEAEYAFGKRNSSMFKFKKKEDGLFEVVDIKEDKRGLPIYTLKNDINDELFECTINLTQDKQREQLAIKHLLIGKTGLVEFRERSGVKQVPFHAKLIKIII